MSHYYAGTFNIMSATHVNKAMVSIDPYSYYGIVAKGFKPMISSSAGGLNS
jgi:hypothetical protein